MTNAAGAAGAAGEAGNDGREESAGPALLLLSSSVVHGRGYLDHAESEIRDFLSRIDEVLFVPYALADWDAYAERAQKRFAAIGVGIELVSVHMADDPVRAAATARAFFVGGGNTFRLLKALQDRRLLEPIRAAIEAGARYLGASAGTNLAGPTIRTTNDMPIVFPASLDGLDLVPFQLNPHYVDPDPASSHMGETREERIAQFHEEAGNRAAVVALREPAYLRREGRRLRLGGEGGARIFEAGETPREFGSGADLSFLIARNA